jgi:hypothetical protein
VRAIQYYPEIRHYYQALSRRKPRVVTCTLVAKELARIVYFMLEKQEAFNGTFKGKALSRTKQPKWPRSGLPLGSPPSNWSRLAVRALRRLPPPHLIWTPGVAPPKDLWDRPRGA